jgi:hypothetical protein
MLSNGVELCEPKLNGYSLSFALTHWGGLENANVCYYFFFVKTAHSKSSFLEERLRLVRTVRTPLPASSRLGKVCLTRRKTRVICDVSYNGVADFVDLLARMREKSGTWLTCLAIGSKMGDTLPHSVS